MGFVLLMLQVGGELVESLVLEDEADSIVLVISFAIPVVAFEFSAIQHFSVKYVSASLCILLRLKLDLHGSLWMGFIESDSLYLSNLLYFLLYLLFKPFDFRVVLSNLWSKYVFDDDNFKALSSLLVLFVLD